MEQIFAASSRDPKVLGRFLLSFSPMAALAHYRLLISTNGSGRCVMRGSQYSSLITGEALGSEKRFGLMAGA